MNRAAGIRALKLKAKVQKANCVERRLQSFELKVKGKTYVEIGKALGISRFVAEQDVQLRITELEGMWKGSDSTMAHWHMAMAKLEAIYAHHYELSEAGSQQAAAICLKCIEQSARLCGLADGRPPGEDLLTVSRAKIMDRVSGSTHWPLARRVPHRPGSSRKPYSVGHP